MDNEFTPKLIEKAKQAKSAKENGVELSEEEAQDYFEQMNRSGELSDDELDNVAGGCGGCGDSGERWNDGYNCRKEGCMGRYYWDAKTRFYICCQCGDKI